MERLPNETLKNAIDSYEATIEILSTDEDFEDITVLDRVTIDFLKELLQYRTLEEQGLLLKLPCKVGDTVWCISDGEVYKAIARKVTIITGYNNYQLIKIEAEFDIVDVFYNDGRLRKYGVYQNYLETVFLTKEEAEAKLKELQNE